MEYSRILVKYGDLTLKGRNKKRFIKQVVDLTKNKLEGLDYTLEYSHDRMYINFNPLDQEKILAGLKLVSGIHSFCLITQAKTEEELNDVKEKALELVLNEIKEECTFKIETKRAYKEFPLTSLDISKEVSSFVLKGAKILHVDVHNPQVVLNIELHKDKTYLYLKEIDGLKGFPVGIAGKGILMLSGGIDSPVAGFLAMKQGIEIECLHFESTPLTSIESAQKVIDLVKKMSLYAFDGKIKIHFFPFKDLHLALLNNVPESYTITIMRRMMYRIAEKVAERNGALCIINGESVGQVASQTLGSMHTINSTIKTPVLRPLCMTDKNDIIKISRMIDTYDISIRPFEDCCTVYVPKSPAISPTIERSEEYEKKFDYEKMIEEGLNNMPTLLVSKDTDLELALYGLEIKDILKA